MYPSYATNDKPRSLSTTDVHRVGRRGVGDDAHAAERTLGAQLSFSTLRRTLRRPTTRPPPPVPPKRSDSFPSAPSPRPSYNARRQFATTAIETNGDESSPRSSNFVKKLVATLERRYKDNAAGTAAAAAAAARRHEPTAQVRPLSLDFQPRCTLPPLELLHEAEHECDDPDSSDADDFFDAWPPQDSHGAPDAFEVFPAAGAPPDDRPKPGGRRSLRSVLSSLINWRIGGSKAAARGSREYYNARESLGEEMRAFRRDTMPRLMERAAVNSRLPELLARRPRRETQDFARLLGRAAPAGAAPRSTATIHPVYGSRLNLAGRERCGGSGLRGEPPGSPPPPPPAPVSEQRQCEWPREGCPRPGGARPLAAVLRVAATPDEHLLRPSRLRELQKRLSQHHLDDGSELADARPAPGATYDVPRSGRPVVARGHAPPTVHYENVGRAVSDDARLSRALFTTF
ncbi:uncharacterized protein LOC131673135 [Phymastichus coffea]|uniref:uncharacterized protein LOC131673135 n=1 Tax=Phymastichus coffea TaxID=108790 RepID=UPI00273B5963|nr:uncharacterized protein LOC131673135 [Phymastichus coffea]